MKIQNGRVIFERADLHFLEALGPVEAVKSVLLHQDPVPFAHDTYQLAALLGTTNRTLWDVLRDPDSHYREYSIPKKNGSLRSICAPDDTLKHIQRAIHCRILSCIPISKYARAYYKGANLRANAAPHVGKTYLLKLDLSDFFGSIRFDRVLCEVFNSRRYPKQIGTILTALCCRGDVLPQGAPTSPAISNIVMKHFDDVFGNWCEKRGLSYTRYCDDLTVSGNISLYLAFQKAKRMLEEMGFEINLEKTHFLSNANRQTVTGLTVNEKISVPADYKRKLRQEVYYACKYGIKDIIEDRYPKEYMEFEGEPIPYIPQLSPDILRRETEHYRNELLGKVQFVLSVEPENRWFLEAKEKLKYAR